MDLIKLPINLGTTIVKILKEKNIKPRIHEDGPSKGMLSLEFSQEELDLITELDIINPGYNELDGIDNLRKLERLNITTQGRTEYQKNAASITDKDIKLISELKQLKSLTIDNQSNISWLLLDNLANLEQLCITRNSNLEEIIGLDKLSKIISFEERGNKSLFTLDGIQALIMNNNLEDFEIDVLHYPEILKQSNKLANMINCNFSEQISGGQYKTVNYSFYQLILFHQKCISIAEKAKSISKDVKNQILFVEKYLAENISYDYDALNTSNKVHYIDGKQKGKKYGTNSAYNGIMFGSAVCEGYTRSMQYILKLMGIKTKNVYCISGKDKISINTSYHNQITLPDDGYHSIIRIDNNNQIYYFDPCWDSCKWHAGDKTLPYSFLTKKEISIDHTLSFEENQIIYDIPHPRTMINDYLKIINNNENTNNYHK